MNINMTGKQYEDLVKLARSSKKEISGIIEVVGQDQEVYVKGFELDSDSLVEMSNSMGIKYKSKEFVTNTIFRIRTLQSGVLIQFHSHPSFRGTIKLSGADTDMLKRSQSLAGRVRPGENITVMECVINLDDMAFYSYDEANNTINRAYVFVDGVEKIPISEKSFLQNLKDGWNEGISKAKRRK